MKRVFFIECSGSVWRSVAHHCREQAGWQAVLWTASAADEIPIAKMSPEALFIAGPDATLGLPDESAAWPLPPLEPELLTALAPAESIALHMMDRMDPRCGAGFTHDDRRRHYHRLLRYWHGALDFLKPDLIVFSIAPHIVFDYVLFALARHRGVPTVMFERLGLPGWVFPLADFERGSDGLRARLQARPAVPVEEVPEAFRTWLTQSASGQAAVPANFQKKLERYRLRGGAQMPSLVRAVGHELKRAVVLVRKYGLTPPPNSYLRSSRYPHGRATPLETLVSRLRGILVKRRLMRLHDALVSQATPGDTYVLLALHYQPERATVPMGGAFGDQTLIVDLLADALPEGWKLYVKEHPWQLQPFGRGEVQRSQAFYAAITRRPNVVLLPRDAATAALVRGAKAVATVTGSVGWDALCAGVPVLLFGAAWYRDCPGVHPVTARVSLVDAMKQIRSGAQPALQTIAAFCAALSSVCVPGVLEPELERAEHLSLDDSAFAMAAKLISFVDEI